MELKVYLDSIVKENEVQDFIKSDPIQFPHRFTDKLDQEISGLIASSLAYGKREKIISSVEKIHIIMQNEPAEFVKSFDFKKDYKVFEGFLHRYTSGLDVAMMIHSISEALKEYDSLESLFMEGYSEDDLNVKNALIHFSSTLTSFIPEEAESIRGLCFLLPNPERGSACKRLNMYLRWMVRSGPVDLNLWKKVSTEKLLIPLDTHVSKISRSLKLTSRKTDDWKTAEEITERLKVYDDKDPAKYDFALFSIGLSGEGVKFKR